MRWDISLNTDIFNDCFDCIIAALVEYNNYDSMLLKLGCFSYRHIDENYIKKEAFHDKITRGISLYKTAQELFHMQIESVPFHKKDIHNIIMSEMGNHPVGIEVDPFYCKWTDFYRKSHWMHDLIIGDINVDEKVYHCIDIYYPTKKQIVVSFDEMEELCNEVFLIHIPKGIVVNSDDVFKYMNRYLEMSLVDARKQENDMVQVFVNNLKLEDIGDPICLNASILLTKLSWIAADKRTFMEGLMYIENKFLSEQIFRDVYKSLTLIEKKIIILKNTLIKYSISKKIQDGVIEHLLKEISLLNIFILETLHAVLTNYNCIGKNELLSKAEV